MPARSADVLLDTPQPEDDMKSVPGRPEVFSNFGTQKCDNSHPVSP